MLIYKNFHAMVYYAMFYYAMLGLGFVAVPVPLVLTSCKIGPGFMCYSCCLMFDELFTQCLSFDGPSATCLHSPTTARR